MGEKKRRYTVVGDSRWNMRRRRSLSASQMGRTTTVVPSGSVISLARSTSVQVIAVLPSGSASGPAGP
jgi:hypothetical protein